MITFRLSFWPYTKELKEIHNYYKTYFKSIQCLLQCIFRLHISSVGVQCLSSALTYFGWTPHLVFNLTRWIQRWLQTETRHRGSTSTYLLTFCVRVMLPERHQWKPAVQAAAIMMRRPPSTASHWRLVRAQPAERSHCRHIAGWKQACN